jgi:ribosomal protein S18 acetylase RimI-like enzyme
MSPKFIVSVLAPDHDRKSFSCGTEALDRYIRDQAGQDAKRRTAVCYVAHAPQSSQIAGYYTLSAAEVLLSELPPDMVRGLPRYPVVPVARLGRLAINEEFQGQRLGSALLWDAARRILRTEIGIFAMVVDAKDEKAAAFYRYHGFLTLQSNPLQLFLPVETLAKTL